MNPNSKIFFTFLVSFVFFIGNGITSFGQNQSIVTGSVTDKPVNDAEWIGALVNAAGENYVNGVDVFYKLVDCNSSKFILIKFVNNNDTEAQVEWADAIYTKDKICIHNERNDKEKVLTIKPKSGIEGACQIENGKINNNLIINIRDYIENSDSFLKYATSYMVVTL